MQLGLSLQITHSFESSSLCRQIFGSPSGDLGLFWGRLVPSAPIMRLMAASALSSLAVGGSPTTAAGRPRLCAAGQLMGGNVLAAGWRSKRPSAPRPTISG